MPSWTRWWSTSGRTWRGGMRWARWFSTVVHALAGWHPAVWFAMGRLRMEREMACDEMVVDATGSAKAYAACLTRVATLAQTSRGSHLAVAMLSSPGLTRRVMRLLARRRTPAFAPHWMMIAGRAGGRRGVRHRSDQPRWRPADRAALDRRAGPLAVHALPALPAATAPLAQTRQQPASPTQARATRTPVAAAVAAGRSAGGRSGSRAATAPASSVASSRRAGADARMPPAFVRRCRRPSRSPRPTTRPGARGTVDRTAVTAEAKHAWAAATQAGESIGLSSRKGAVATAGFFTRLSKKVATSF